MIVQQIQVSETKGLYIFGFNPDTNEITYRDTVHPEHLQKEILTIIEEVCYTTKYNFHKNWLDKFLKENE